MFVYGERHVSWLEFVAVHFLTWFYVVLPFGIKSVVSTTRSKSHFVWMFFVR
jgi:predicted secreted protein